MTDCTEREMDGFEARVNLRLSVTDDVSDEALRALASRGGLAALLEAIRNAEKQLRFQGQIHALQDAPGLAKVTHLMADELGALLPQTGEAEPEKPTPASVSEGERDSGIDAFLSDVRAEFHRGREKFPSNELKTVALSEEFGELVKAVLDEAAADVRKEAVQLAAMCLRLVMDGDSSVDGWRERNGLDALSKREDG